MRVILCKRLVFPCSCGGARRLGLVDDEVTVKMPGGALTIDMREPNIRMTGPAVRSFDLVFSPYLMRLAMNMKENGD